jgi:hypothetical protein
MIASLLQENCCVLHAVTHLSRDNLLVCCLGSRVFATGSLQLSFRSRPSIRGVVVHSSLRGSVGFGLGCGGSDRLSYELHVNT